MLGIRFPPHGAAPSSSTQRPMGLTNQVVDYRAVAGTQVAALYERLLEANTEPERIVFIEALPVDYAR